MQPRDRLLWHFAQVRHEAGQVQHDVNIKQVLRKRRSGCHN